MGLKRIKRIAFALAVLVIADLVVGLTYRAIVGDSVYYTLADHSAGVERQYRTKSPTYHHGLKKSVTVSAIWGNQYSMATNSLGFKDKEVRNVPVTSRQYRVLFMGDSFTEGVGYPYEQTFVGHIDQRWSKRRVEVLNAGVSSYSPAIYYRKTKCLIEEVGLEFNEMVVFIDISDAKNDSLYFLDDAGNVACHLDDFSGPKPLLREYSVAYALPRAFKVRKLQAESLAFQGLNASIGVDLGQWTVDEQAYRAYGAQGAQNMQKNMDLLHDLLKQHQRKLTVVVYPWPTQIYHKDLNSRQVEIWSRWCQDRNVQFINLFPDFISDSATINEETVQRYYIPHDFHWCAAGHEFVTDRFLEHFQMGKDMAKSES